MKTTKSNLLAGIAALALLFGFGMVGCGGDDDENNTNPNNNTTGKTLAAALKEIDAAESKKGTTDTTTSTYSIVLNQDEPAAAKVLLTYTSTRNRKVEITLQGNAAGRKVTLDNKGTAGALFTIYNNVTLTLENITLEGRSDNTSTLVSLTAGGTLVMNKGSVICGNTNTKDSLGGGVYVATSSTFTMNNGEISGNTAQGTTSGNGGGVFADGTFTMKGGIIKDNTAKSKGGGVYVDSSGVFTKEGSAAAPGGIIYGNDESDTALQNKAKSAGDSHAVFKYDSNINLLKSRDTTVKADEALSTSDLTTGWNE